jgi:hypothetical protein
MFELVGLIRLTMLMWVSPLHVHNGFRHDCRGLSHTQPSAVRLGSSASWRSFLPHCYLRHVVTRCPQWRVQRSMVRLL